MNIGEAMGMVQKWASTDLGHRVPHLEALEHTQAALHECPEDVPWDVRLAYNTVIAAMRELFSEGGTNEA
jgi:hypothetical protein